MKIHPIFSGPSITHFVNIENDIIKITGSSKRVSRLFLNNRQINTNLNGDFEEIYVLNIGPNYFKIEGVDRYDKKKTIDFVEIYSPK